MGNIDDRDVLRLQVCNDTEKVFNLCVRKCGSGLVHDNDVGVMGNCLRDFDHLLLRDRQIFHLCIDIYFEVELLEESLGLCIECLVVAHEFVLHGLAAKPEVVRDCTLKDRGQLLLDHGDTCMDGVLDALKVNFLALVDNGSCCDRLHADQAFHQSGFSGAVLSHQGVNCSGTDLELNTVESLYTWKVLTYPVHFQNIFISQFVLPPRL